MAGTTEKIDRFWDMIDGVVDRAGSVLDRTRRAEHAVKGDDNDDNAQIAPSGPPSSSKAMAVSRARFRIIESIDGETGAEIFIVTDGQQRAECSTRELAARLLTALEKAP